MTLPLAPDELLSTTRSVRKRLDFDRPVPLELVRECLELAMQAPTGSNMQTWHWMVVTDPELRRGIGEHYKRSYDAYRPGRDQRNATLSTERQVVGARVADSADYLAERMGEVPVLVLACITASAELPTGNQAGLWGSLLPAAWSYQLAARSRGLGTAWTTLHLAYEAEVAQLLGIPPHVRQGVLLPTAYYTGETFRPAPREPLDAVLHLDRW
ncbi:MAG: nitroreductase family protein [Pseudonocardia sp.]